MKDILFMNARKSFLQGMLFLLLLPGNVHASSWRFENYHTSTFCTIPILLVILAMQDEILAKVREKYTKQQEESDVIISSQEEDIAVKNAKNMIDVATVLLGIVIIPSLFFTLKDVYQFYFPFAEDNVTDLIAQEKLKYIDKEQSIKAFAVHEELDFFTIKKNFKNCLFKNQLESKRGFLNSPIACEELARTFVRSGGKNDLVNMITAFDDAGK